MLISLDFRINYFKCNVTNVTWESSNTSVATVDKNGKVTIEGFGNAVSTVSARGRKTNIIRRSTTKIKVLKPTVTCSRKNITLKKGGTTVITVNVKNYPSRFLKCSSDNEDVVSLHSYAYGRTKIVACGYGKATITASLEGVENVEDLKINVTVSQPKMVCHTNSVTLEKGKYKSVSVSLTNVPRSDYITWGSSDENVAVAVGENTSNKTVTITAKDYGTATTKYLPSNENVEWTVEDPSIVSISTSGTRNSKVTFEGITAGSTTITGTVPGGASASFVVTVTPR